MNFKIYHNLSLEAFLRFNSELYDFNETIWVGYKVTSLKLRSDKSFKQTLYTVLGRDQFDIC